MCIWKNIGEVVKSLEEASHVIIKWFNHNQLQGNASNCPVLLSTDQQVYVIVSTAQIKNSQYEKLLGVTFDMKLSFNTYIQQICGKATTKLKALARIAPSMNIEKTDLNEYIF